MHPARGHAGGEQLRADLFDELEGAAEQPLVDGKVSMARQYALDDDELEEGFVLACQSVPETPTLSLDFDA